MHLKGSHYKLAKAHSIIFSIISLYSCAEKSKEVGCGDLMECETIEVMEFDFEVLGGLHFGEDDIGWCDNILC